MSEVSVEALLLGLPASQRLHCTASCSIDDGRVFGRLDLPTEMAPWLGSNSAPTKAFRNDLAAAFSPVTTATGFALETRQHWPSRPAASSAVAKLIAPYASQDAAHLVLRPPLQVDRYQSGVRTRDNVLLPDHLARYAFAYLMSSIVRYNPARVESCGDAPLRAVLDLAVDEARTSILLDSAFFIARVIVV